MYTHSESDIPAKQGPNQGLSTANLISQTEVTLEIYIKAVLV